MPPPGPLAPLTLSMDSIYNGTPPFTPKMTEALFRLDDDFLITPDTAAQCDPDTPGFATSTTEAAIAACPGAYLGTGGFTLEGAVPLTGITTTFNATPGPGAVPRLIIHMRTTASTTTLLTGDITSSTTFVDYFHRLEFDIPIFPLDLVINHLDFRIGEPGSPSADSYFTARCADAATEWNYSTGWAFNDTSNDTDAHEQQCSVAPPAPPPDTTSAPLTTPLTTTTLPITSTPKPAKKKDAAKKKEAAKKKKKKRRKKK